MSLLTIFMLYILAFAHAIPLAKRDVIDPHITSPTAQTIWNVGDKVTVTWDTSEIPPASSNSSGMLLLGFQTSDSENLDLDHPLADGFKLVDGSVSFNVPDVAPKTNYIVVLFGDSGNASPQFSITDGIVSPSVTPSSGAPTRSSAPPDSSTPASSATPSSAPDSTPTSGVSVTSPAPSSTPTAPSTVLSFSSAPASSTPSSSATSLPDQGSTTTPNGALSRHVDALTLSITAGVAAALMALL
ncbi:hypothetical protein FA95DRAFT_1562597 [Auriscalpium vulgare]|uniref:Uncharacterized protein n=1 Tax=Auriscalpium vulgare TaxID=40419 RepID=A0ACB8RJ03_9AGAM|nr:hypothetical protein FA95DRAFT_1562597 [Auriscalpium vulgare]